MVVRSTSWIWAFTALAALAGWAGNSSLTQNDKVGSDVSVISVNMKELGPDNQPIIFWRINQEDRDAVTQLLDAGYDIEIKGGFGATPVIAAALIDDWITVLLLLERGANAFAADRRGFTMTHLLASSRVDPNGRFGKARTQVRDFLESRRMDVNAYEPALVKAMMADGTWPPQKSP